MPETHTLRLLPERFAICRLPADAPAPPFPQASALHAVTRTAEELSVVCVEANAPEEARVERGFRCLKVEGPFDLGVVGVMASLAVPLARAGVSVFVVSTFDTDYVLVRDPQLEDGIRALEAEGHRVLR